MFPSILSLYKDVKSCKYIYIKNNFREFFIVEQGVIHDEALSSLPLS